MDQDRQHPAFVEPGRTRLVHQAHRRTGHAFDDRVHELEVRRVGHHRHLHVDRLAALQRPARALVVFHVAGPAQVVADHPVLPFERVLELGKDLRVRLVQDVRQDVQPAAVGHAQEDRRHAVFCGRADHLVEDRDHHVQALDREPRLARVKLLQELLERLDLRQPFEQRNGIDRVLRRAVAARLHCLPQPRPRLGLPHVREIEPDVRLIHLAQPPDCLQSVRRLLSKRPAHQMWRQRLEVVLGDGVGRQFQARVARRRRAERVDLRCQVPEVPDRVREVNQAHHGFVARDRPHPPTRLSCPGRRGGDGAPFPLSYCNRRRGGTRSRSPPLLSQQEKSPPSSSPPLLPQ